MRETFFDCRFDERRNGKQLNISSRQMAWDYFIIEVFYNLKYLKKNCLRLISNEFPSPFPTHARNQHTTEPLLLAEMLSIENAKEFCNGKPFFPLSLCWNWSSLFIRNYCHSQCLRAKSIRKKERKAKHHCMKLEWMGLTSSNLSKLLK